MMRAANGGAPIVAALLTSGCGLCGDDIQRQQVSPDSALVATAFVRDCGATTNYSSIVSIHGRSESIDDDRSLVFVIEGRHSPDLTWTEEGALLIRCADCSPGDVFRQVSVLGGVKVFFELRLPAERFGIWAAAGQRLDQFGTDQFREMASPNRLLSIRQSNGVISLVAPFVVSELDVPSTPPLSEVLWAPDSAAFVINASDGGTVGGWDAYLYTVAAAGAPALRDLRPLIEPQAKGTAQCDTDEVVNLGVATWLNGGKGVLVILEVPPHSSCRNAGSLVGYEVSLADLKILERLPETTLRTRWGGSLGSRFRK